MGDYTIRGAFEVEAPPSDVKKWLDSAAGIAGWWSDGVTGDAGEEGGTFTVRFPDTDVPFELEVREVSDRSVAWHVAENPPWWKDTTIRFDLAPAEGGGTNLLFTHGGFEPDNAIIAPITPAWVRFVDNLAAVARSGRANPAVRN